MSKRSQDDIDLDNVLTTPSGRRFVWRLLAGLEGSPMHTDPHLTYFQLGAQDSARALQVEILRKHLHWHKLMLAERYGESEDKPCVTADDK